MPWRFNLDRPFEEALHAIANAFQHTSFDAIGVDFGHALQEALPAAADRNVLLLVADVSGRDRKGITSGFSALVLVAENPLGGVRVLVAVESSGESRRRRETPRGRPRSPQGRELARLLTTIELSGGTPGGSAATRPSDVAASRRLARMAGTGSVSARSSLMLHTRGIS
jgi:hypothetical protein